MLALALVVFGVRLAVFAHAGNPLPFYDEWLALYNNLFLTGSGGHSLAPTLLLPHNEHHLITTKLLYLAGYLLNGYSEPRVLILAAAVVRALEAAIAWRLLSSGSPAARIPVLLACLIVFAAPLSAYNTLCGLQVSFFLAELALLWSIHTMLRWRSGVGSGMQLLLALILGLSSLASAIVIPAATLAAHLAIRRPRAGFMPAWALSTVVAVAFALHGSSSENELFSAERLQRWPGFFLELAGWPFGSPLAGALVLLFGTLVLVRLFSLRPGLSPGAAAGLAIMVFGAGNAGLLALARTPETVHMRHWETLLLIPLGLTAVVAHLASEHFRVRLALRTAGPVLGILYVVALGTLFARETLPYFERANATRDAAVTHYRNLLLSGRVIAHAAETNDKLVARDYRFFDDPIGRFSVHPVVATNLARSGGRGLLGLSPEILPARERSVLSIALQTFFRWGAPLAWAGVALLLAALVWPSRDQPAGSRPAG